MEVCPEAERIASEDPATVCDRAFQIGKGLEVAVRERLIQNGPEVLGGLKLGGVWGQVDEPEALRHDQVRRGVPAGAVEPEHDDAIPPRPRAQTAPAARRRTAWRRRSTRTRTPRRRSAGRRRSHKATCSGGGQVRWAADPWGPTPAG